MGLREWSSKHPAKSYSVVGACVVVCIGAIVAEVPGSRHRYPSGPPDSYFTVDDGKTYFSASSTNYPPFEYKGQTAVHACVFQADGHKFVGFLERYASDVKKRLDSGEKLTPQMVRFGRELKRPGDTVWVRTGDMQKETAIENVTSPTGQGELEVVEP